MILRLFFVALVLTALLGIAYYFSDQIIVYLDAALALDKAGRERILELMDIALKGAAIIAALSGAIAFIGKLLFPEKKGDDSNNTVINDGVRVHGGDFVLGNKTQQDDKDAG